MLRARRSTLTWMARRLAKRTKRTRHPSSPAKNAGEEINSYEPARGRASFDGLAGGGRCRSVAFFERSDWWRSFPPRLVAGEGGGRGSCVPFGGSVARVWGRWA